MPWYTKTNTYSSTSKANNATGLNTELTNIQTGIASAFSANTTNVANIATNMATGVTNAAGIAANLVSITALNSAVGIGVTGLINQYLIGQAMDNGTVFPTGNPTAAVTVPANTAPYGIYVQIYATIFHAAVSAGEDLVIPLNITNAGLNPGDLSASGSRNYRFECYAGFSLAAGVRTPSPMFYLTAGDDWEPTIANTVQIGTPFRSGTNMTAQNFGIIVHGLRQP